MTDDDRTRLPLVPLSNVVLFPRTALRLQVVEPAYRRLVRDLLARSEDGEGWLGLVLLKPDGALSAAGQPAVFPGGTATRVVDAELLPDGRSTLLLHGEFRFELQREIDGAPYREALVRPLAEPEVDERDAGVVAVRRGLLAAVRSLGAELGARFPVGQGEVEVEELGDCLFEELVNRIAAELDLPPLRKLQLLVESLPDRALSVLAILTSRQQVVDLLRPYRHLADGSQHN
jgi:Lon protease-like protein